MNKNEADYCKLTFEICLKRADTDFYVYVYKDPISKEPFLLSVVGRIFIIKLE